MQESEGFQDDETGGGLLGPSSCMSLSGGGAKETTRARLFAETDLACDHDGPDDGRLPHTIVISLSLNLRRFLYRSPCQQSDRNNVRYGSDVLRHACNQVSGKVECDELLIAC